MSKDSKRTVAFLFKEGKGPFTIGKISIYSEMYVHL
ncbi:hypothetical protein DOK67_0000394 [Enterococcus sp. DIV0212c]